MYYVSPFAFGSGQTISAHADTLSNTRQKAVGLQLHSSNKQDNCTFVMNKIAKDKKILNMTEGRPFVLLARFALPLLIGNLFQQLYNLADSVIVGRLLGADPLAAVGASSSVTFLFFALCNGIGNGGGIVTAQCFGDGNTKMVKRCIINTGYVMVIFPLIIGIIAFFCSKGILTVLGTPENIMADALAYAKTMCVGIVFVAIYNYIAAMLQALGDSKTPLKFLITACCINIVLDIAFIKFLNMSVIGAGIATVIAQFISGAGCILYSLKTNEYFKFTRDDFTFDKALTVRILKLGFPLSLQFSLISISCMALQFVVNSFGSVAIAAFTAVSRIEQIIHQPYGTLGTALSNYTGQNYGAKKGERIKKGFASGMLLMLIFSLIMLPIMQLLGDDIIHLFVEDAAVIAMGGKALRITSWFYVVLGLIYVCRGVQNGLGDGFFALLNGIIEIIGRFCVPIILTSMPLFGVWGIWWSVGFVWLLSGVTAWLRYVYYKKHNPVGRLQLVQQTIDNSI